MSSGRFEEQRARNLERTRGSGVPDSVARLFAVVQEPRCDDEPSTPEFDGILKDEAARLRERISGPASGSGTLFEVGGFGGLLETEATTSARRLLSAAETEGMARAAELLRAALDRCGSIPQFRAGVAESPSFPEHERILNPKTGRPIGMWR
ncbi:hypothetical protein [Acrocarpospora sp. B8E8]|uniref:hypothetical protein n=1 Tax=Acrocarpospora sp. B8E8 TaxID=3153572 RepID=UPI00325F93B6